jgi:hypothetical protein
MMVIFKRRAVLRIDLGVRPVLFAIASKSIVWASSTSSRSWAWDHPGRLRFGGIMSFVLHAPHWCYLKTVAIKTQPTVIQMAVKVPTKRATSAAAPTRRLRLG